MYDSLREFVERNGWTFKLGLLGYPYISGEYQGCPFTFDFGAQKGGFLTSRLRNVLTFFIHNSVGVELKLRGGALTSLESMIFMPGLQTGDKSFDRQFVLDGSPRELVLKLFENDKIRQGFVKAQLSMGYFSLNIDQQMLICDTTFSFAWYTEKNIIEILNVTGSLADAINNL